MKVLDFGLAKAVEPAAGSSAGVANSPTITTPAMTQAGMILGTAAYMSPEQVRGKTVDKRADIWAFGGVIYEILTGARLFPGDSVTDILAPSSRASRIWRRCLPPRPGVSAAPRPMSASDPRQRLRDIGDARLILADARDTPVAAKPVPLPACSGAGCPGDWPRLQYPWLDGRSGAVQRPVLPPCR